MARSAIPPSATTLRSGMADERSKHRLIAFAATSPAQPERALAALQALPDLHAETVTSHPHCLRVHYRLDHYTLATIETYLLAQGFTLETGISQRLVRAIVHYAEDIQLHNDESPPRLLKSRDAYSTVWTHHLHGDHDDTPPEWRDYR